MQGDNDLTSSVFPNGGDQDHVKLGGDWEKVEFDQAMEEDQDWGGGQSSKGDELRIKSEPKLNQG